MINNATKWKSRIGLGLILASFVVSSFSSVIFLNSKSSAYTYTNIELTTSEACTSAGGVWTTDADRHSYCRIESRPDENAKVFAYAGWLAQCMKNQWNTQKTLSADDIREYKIVKIVAVQTAIGYMAEQDDGAVKCSYSEDVELYTKGLGYPDFIKLIDAAGCKPIGKGSYSCDFSRVSADTIFKNIFNTKYGSGAAILTNIDKYHISLNTFEIGCKAEELVNPSDADKSAADNLSDKVYRVGKVDSEGNITSAIYTAEKGRGANTNTMPKSIGWNNGVFECGTLADMTVAYADNFAKWVKNNADAAKKTLAASLAKSSTPAASKSTCVIEGIGWIICPTMKFFGALADGSFYFISGLLSIQPKLLGASDTSGTFVAWSYFRNIANVLFVIAFMIIIFSQLTSVGITNYGIKKLLPKLIITAILVNISFYICQIAVDLSEILGHTLNTLLGETIPKQIGIPASTSTWVDNLGGILSGVVVLGIGAVTTAAAIAAVALSITIPVLLMALLSILMILIILVGRQAAIVILIFISPLAFVAYLLPNTEQWFKKWYKMFWSLLMVYPIVSLLFGAGKLTGLILHNAAGNNFLMNITALGVTAIPLIAVPSILKGALNSTGALGAKLSGWSSMANNGVKSQVKNGSTLGTTLSDIGSYRSRQRQIKLAGRRTSTGGVMGRINPLLNGLGGKGYSGHVSNRGNLLEAQIEAEDLKNAQIPLEREISETRASGGDVAKLLRDRAASTSHTGAERSAAVHSLASMGMDSDIRKLKADPNVDQRHVEAAIQANAGSFLSKAPDLVKGSSAAFESVSGSDLAGFSETTSEAYMKHLGSMRAKATAPGATAKDIEKFSNASQSFNSAVEGITLDASLQAKFSEKSGRAIQKAVSEDAALEAFAKSNMHGLSAIGSDGKIR